MAWLKRALTLVLFAILLYLFWPLVKEFRNLGVIIRQANWGWLLAAVVIQLISYGFLAELNRLLLRPFPGQIGFWRMMAVLPAMAFIEVTIPSAGASGVILRARLLGKSGYSAETSTFTVALETMFVGVLMASVSLLGIGYMFREGEIRPFQVITLAMIAAILFVAGGFAVWFGRDRERVKRLLLHWNEIANRWLERYHRKTTPAEQVIQRMNEFYNGLTWLRHRPTWPYWLTSLGRVSLDVACLAACFAAFNYTIAAGPLLTGYGLMLLISGLAALPGGLGMADLSLSIIYARLGAPGAVAIAAALSYRLIAWWMVRFIGFITWQVLEADGGKN
jgi:putative heme transporter